MKIKANEKLAEIYEAERDKQSEEEINALKDEYKKLKEQYKEIEDKETEIYLKNIKGNKNIDKIKNLTSEYWNIIGKYTSSLGAVSVGNEDKGETRQIINVAGGGTLHQDLSLIGKSVLKHNQVSKPTLKTHKIQIEENSVISSIFGKETMVNSFHHQAIDKVGDDLKVVARASDGVVEAIEHKTYKFLVAVQWHPEMLAVECDEARKLFNRLIEEAKK